MGDILRTLVLGGLLALVCLQPALAAKRVALVVGIDRYEALPKLEKAVNDARAVSAALSEIGFQVVTGENLTRREMNRKLADLESQIAPGDTAFFFFAGHGVALGAENILIAADMPAPQANEEGLVRDEGFSVDAVIRRIHAKGAAASLLVLDACRDNPFEAAGTRGIGLSRGLSRVEAPSGVFVLYSAGLGQTALDRLTDSDPDLNSVFTRKLLPLLKTAGLSHVDLAKQVQQEVDTLAATVKHAQQPAYYDQIIGKIVLKAAESIINSPAVEPAAPTQATEPAITEQMKQLQAALTMQLQKVEASTTDAQKPSGEPPMSEEARVWLTIEKTASCGILESFVSRFPSSVYADFAKARQKELRCGEQALTTVSPAEPAATPTAPDTATDLVALAKKLQSELKRVGCYQGEGDGQWGSSSIAALERYNEEVNATLIVLEPTIAALKTLETVDIRVCRRRCPDGYTLQEGKCMDGLGDGEAKTGKKSSKNKVKKKQIPATTANKSNATIGATKKKGRTKWCFVNSWCRDHPENTWCTNNAARIPCS